MEYNHDEVYCFKTQFGTQKTIKKVPEIENMVSDINKMSDIGKLTDLFWGYNIVTDTGVILRKFKFLSDYPKKAKKLINAIYPKFYPFCDRAKIGYRENRLNDEMFELIGFTLTKTKYLR